MIDIQDPQGPQACRDLMDGMLVVAQMRNLAPGLIISASLSIISAMASKSDAGSQKVIASGLRAVLSAIESGDFPVQDGPLGQQFAAGTKLH